MNTHKLGVIISREYTTRVKKKSFIILTFVVPVLFAALCVLPSVIMMATKEEGKKIAVVDESGMVMPYFKSGETVKFEDMTSAGIDALKADMKGYGVDGIVHISPLDTLSRSVSVESFSSKPLGLDLSESVEKTVNTAVEEYRISAIGIDGLEKIIEGIQSDIHMVTYTLDDSGHEKITSSEVYMIVSMLLGIVIYMFIAMFCGTVMSSVIEEKSSRVVEVLVSSVKATELLFGKIIGVALVALTQFMMWVVLTGVLVAAVGGILGLDTLAAASADPTGIMEMPEVSSDSFSAIVSTLAGLNYVKILAAFVIFFSFGYLLYASLFAAIGSAVENEADTQQLQIPVTAPLLLGFFIALYAFKAPDSAVVFWGSMIPFTSPIVMLARIPYGVPTWQLVLSIALLIGTFLLCAWVSAKIYKVGILMFGKKSTFKDLWKWLRLK